MKKILFTLALMIAAATSLSAQNVDDLFKEFRDKPNVQFVNIPKALMSVIANKTNSEETKERLKNIELVRVLQIENDKDLLDQFAKKVKKIAKKYEQMVNSNEEGQKAQILVKTDGEVLKEVLIISIEEDECALVQVCGELRPEDLEKLDDFIK